MAMAEAIDMSQQLLPCILQDQCQCSVEEENPAVTSIILKHGKTYDFCRHNVSVINCASPESIQPADVSGTLPKTSNFDNNQHRQKRTRKNKPKEGSTKKKPEHKIKCTTTTNNSIKNQVLSEQTCVSLQFQLLAQQFEQNISRLKTALSALSQQSQQQGSDKTKCKKMEENLQHISVIESRILELEMQKENAQLGFNRADMCANADIRKQRELFRLKSPLPALAKRQDFEQAVIQNQFVVVMGHTGSGKSTQLTQYIADLLQFENKTVICTQPRKIAAVTLTQRVAFEFAGGHETSESKKWVGCHVGGENRLHRENRIQYMTETVLLNQITQSEVTREDPFLNCGAVVLDEAHSRTITTDVLLGVLKRKIHLWPHLKVVVTSATIDTDLFSKYMDNCPVIEIPGRLYPVEVVYRPSDRDNGKIVEAVVKQAIDICNEHQSGDVLCFLTGQNEVEWATRKFTASVKSSPSRAKKIVAYSLYGKQTPEEQQKVFEKTPNIQKVIFSTDIAETSITIDGVKFIVDSGLTKNLVFDSARNISSLKEMMISSASAEQRKGRAGRTGPGTCYRMYSEDEYSAMEKYDKAEIFSRPLSITVTLLKAMRVDPLDFNWLEKPDRSALEAATEELHLLGALDHRQDLTPLGHLIGDLQIDPGIAHMIYYACHKGLGKAATSLAGLFSVTSMLFWRGGEDETRQASDEAKKKFFNDRGDIFTGHLAFTEWLHLKSADPSMKTAKAWCMENYINNKAMNMAFSTAQEIELHLKRNASHIWKKDNQNRQPTEEEVQKLIAQAFVLNVAYKVNKNYVALRADVITYVHPGSVFFRGKELPQVITYQNILRTSKTFALHITPIDMEWIRQEKGALHALYEERASQVNIFEVRVAPVSRKILRYILGPANRNVDALNQELDCLVHGDYENDALVAWCKPSTCNFVFSELTRRVESRKTDLELQVREDPVVGETRIVWGCGGEAKLLLFHGDYVGINIRNVPNSWTLTDVELLIRQKLSQPIKDVVRELIFLPKNTDQKSRSARIVFGDPIQAATAFQDLSTEKRGSLEFSPALSNRPSVYKESEAWLDITFAIAPSQKSVIVIYNSMEDANNTIGRRCLGFRPSNSKPKDNVASSVYHPLAEGGRYVKQLNPFGVKIQYALYANRLPAHFDEENVENELVRYGCPPPSYIKIVRGPEMKFENLTGKNETDAILKYAKENALLPLHEKILDTFVRRDKTRKKVSIRARYESMDQIEMIHVSRLCRSEHYEQFVKTKAQIKTSLRLEKKLWEFRQQHIQTYLEGLKTSKNIKFKIETKPIAHVWLHLEVPLVENVDEIRRKIDQFLQFRFYKNSDIQLLFTHYGQKQLSNVDVTPGYVNVNFATKAIRIYGYETERKRVEDQLNHLVETLGNLCIDVPLILRKTSLSVVEKNLTKYSNGGLRDQLRLSYNRLYATGTQEGIEALKESLKDHIIQPRDEIGSGDCGICFSPLEQPVFFQLCAHKFCTECITAMVNQQTVPYPIVCPADGCGIKLCLQDIQAIAPISAMEKIGQSAIGALLLSSKNKYRPCVKTGCEQFIPIAGKKMEVNEQILRGGEIVFCDQCNLHYCVTCSDMLKMPVERHKGSSCLHRQLTQNKDARLHRLYILDEICMLRCPRCRTAFIDFDGCCALYCSMANCKAGFCFFCLEDCGRDAHNHVRACSKNPNSGDYFISASKKNAVHKESRKRSIVQYLMKTCEDRGLRSSVLHSIEKELKELEIIINPSEVNLMGYTPVEDTAKHRQHILDEICTLRCPRCRSAFFDFDGCSAIQCWNEACKSHFCFFCLEDCGDDEQKTFAHVIRCRENIVPGQLQTPSDLVDKFNCQRRKNGIIKYLLSNCSDLTERQAVIDSVSINLKELNIAIHREDLTAPAPRVIAPLPPAEPVGYAQYYAPRNNFVPERPLIEPRIPPRPAQPRAPERRPAEHGRPGAQPRPKEGCIFL